MKVHEYQAKEILRRYGVPTPRGIVVDNADDVHKPRPTRFTTAPGSGYVLVRFEPR